MAYEEQVSAGIARLDLEFGSREAWAERITEPLDLSHGRKCWTCRIELPEYLRRAIPSTG